jgi:hypothetical protein
VGVRLTAPDGREWVVSRSVRWPQFRARSGLDLPDFSFVDVPSDSIIGGIIAAIVIGLLVAVLVIVLLPVFLLIVEGAFVIAATVFFRRTWVVTARCFMPPLEREWRVRGVFRSRAAVREVAEELRRGVIAEPEHAEVA